MVTLKDSIRDFTVAMLCNTFHRKALHIFTTGTGKATIRQIYTEFVVAYLAKLNTNEGMASHIQEFATYYTTKYQSIAPTILLKKIVEEFMPGDLCKYTGSIRDQQLGRSLLIRTMQESCNRLLKSNVVLDNVVNKNNVAYDSCSKVVSDAIEFVRIDLMTEKISKKSSTASAVGVTNETYNILKKKHDILVAETNNIHGEFKKLEEKTKKMIEIIKTLQTQNNALMQRLRDRESMPKEIFAETFVAPQQEVSIPQEISNSSQKDLQKDLQKDQIQYEEDLTNPAEDESQSVISAMSSRSSRSSRTSRTQEPPAEDDRSEILRSIRGKRLIGKQQKINKKIEEIRKDRPADQKEDSDTEFELASDSD